VIVHGTNFPPGSRINLTLDGTSSAGSITVRSDGTFDAQASIPTSWQPNSQHVFQAQATGQDGRALAQAQQTVTIPLTTGPIPTTPTTPTTLTTSTVSPTASSCAASTTGTVTDLTFTFSGAAPCPMSVVRNDGCKGSTNYPGTYDFIVVGTVNGTLYTFILVTAAYTGPGTYTANWAVVLDVGDITSTGPGNGWRAPFTGTVTVNGDEMSGSVDALMNQNLGNTSGTVQVTGNWTCSTLQRS
jgi:hypothetical protein